MYSSVVINTMAYSIFCRILNVTLLIEKKEKKCSNEDWENPKDV